MSKLYNTKFKPTKAGLVQAAVDFVIKRIPRKKKVSPDIKSVEPTKDIKGSVKRTKQDQYLKNINDLNKARKKITEGKKMMKEGQKIRKQMTGTKRAFQFKNIKSYHAVEPGSKKIDPASIKQEKTKKFKTAKELEREKKMGGGMMGRRKFRSGTEFGSADGVITPYEKRRRQAIEAAIKAREGQRKSPLKEMTKPKKIESPMKKQPPEDPMRDRMKQPLKRKKP